MGDDGRSHTHAFPTTRWSLLRGDDTAALGRAWDVLATRYWRPIVAYVRARWARDDERAVELTQDFFAWMLERALLERVEPGRGRFRGFVKRCLAHHIIDEARRDAAERRGGGRAVVPLDAAALQLPDPDGRTPDELLDDLWRAELLAQANAALERELRARGQDTAWELFRAWHLDKHAEPPEYPALAERFGVTTTDVSNLLSRARKRWRAHLRVAVLDTVGSDEDLRAELAWLLEDAGS